MKSKIRNAEAVELKEVLTNISKVERNPLKFCIARNIRALEGPVAEYMSTREVLWRDAVKIDENGIPVVREEFKEMADQMGGRIPYPMFEYNSEAAWKEFSKKLHALNMEEFEIEFAHEKLDRRIKISTEEGKMTDSTIEGVLEDPNNKISSDTIAVLMKYFLD